MTEAHGKSPAGVIQARPRLDRYELIAEIASGGMGAVYLARVEGVGGFERLFAIKLMHPHLAQDAEFVAMLLDEARLAARLHHPNAVGIVDVCSSEAGYYLVMEYVDGFTMSHVLTHPTLDAEQRIRLCTRILVDGAVGLDAAHRLTDHDGTLLGIVHRDVSPQNILVGCDGIGRITDFGIARAAARITASRPGIIKGKPCYMSPEHATGKEVDARSDIFVLGSILWEVLTGRNLFLSREGDMATLMNVVNLEVPPPSVLDPTVPSELDAVCLKALSRDLEDRFPTAREFAVALDQAAMESGLLASTHVVADAMNELFADKIERRRSAIRKHLENKPFSQPPQMGSERFHLPRLPSTDPDGPDFKSGRKSLDRRDSGPAEEWHEGVESAEAMLAVTRNATPSGRPHADSISARSSAPAIAVHRSHRLILAGLLVAVLGVAGVLALVLRDEPGPANQADQAGPTEEPAAIDEPSSPPSEAFDRAEAAASALSPESTVEPEVDAISNGQVEMPPQPDRERPVETTIRETVPRSHPRRAAVDRPGPPGEARVEPRPAPDMRVIQVEENPYLRNP